jgi:hypothetical protein
MKALHLLSKKTIEHADKMVWNDERKRLFRPEQSPLGLTYACKDGQVQDYTLPQGIVLPVRCIACQVLLVLS